MRVTILAIIIGLLAYGCGGNKGNMSGSKGTIVRGDISGAANMQVNLDNVSIGKPSEPLLNTTADANGHFEFSFTEGLSSGIYRIRIGKEKVDLVFDGSESNVNVSAKLSDLRMYNYEVTGSKDSKLFLDVIHKLIGRKFQVTDVKNFADTTANPLLGVFVTSSALGGNKQFIVHHNSALNRLKKEAPNSKYVSEYEAFIAKISQQQQKQSQRQQSSGMAKVGQPAPDIVMKNPDGKTFKLSDLKGKVVLLDFWASWCGPCRRENPNVVAVYDKYKDKGFTVFSVSLDGLDSRTKARYKTQDQIDNAMVAQKKRWVDAIAKDNLKWKYHVSDLKKWENAASRMYGVTSIPRAFIIDKDGNVAKTSVRGAAQIEAAIKELL